MRGPELRTQLADVVANVLPPEWTVYHAIPEVASLPAAVVAYRNPSMLPSRMGRDCIVYSLTVTLMEARSTGTTGYDSVDEQGNAVRVGLYGVNGLKWESTDTGIGPPQGGVETIAAVLNLTLEA